MKLTVGKEIVNIEFDSREGCLRMIYVKDGNKDFTKVEIGDKIIVDGIGGTFKGIKVSWDELFIENKDRMMVKIKKVGTTLVYTTHIDEGTEIVI